MDKAAKSIFTTLRLTIRDFAESDWKQLQSFGQKPEVARMMASLKSPWPDSDVKEWMQRGPYRAKLGFGAGIYLNDLLIGFVGIGGDPVNCAYAIDPDHWGNGYASEALQGLLSHCFTHLGLQTVEADHFDDNPVSGHILRKTGFVKIATGMAPSAARLESSANTTYRLTKPQFKAEPL